MRDFASSGVTRGPRDNRSHETVVVSVLKEQVLHKHGEAIILAPRISIADLHHGAERPAAA
jgi:hypothetical protein